MIATVNMQGGGSKRQRIVATIRNYFFGGLLLALAVRPIRRSLKIPECIEGSRLLTPGFRTMDDACCFVHCGERFWQSATTRRRLIDVSVECSVAAEFVANVPLRIEYENLQAKFVADGLNDRSEVGIAGNKNKGIGLALERIYKHRRGNVDIR